MGHSGIVSHIHESIESFFSLTMLVGSLLVGGIRCKTFLTRTVFEEWLINSDSTRFIPMMITRMIISLKKVASSRPPRLDMKAPIGLPTKLQDTRSPRTPDDIQLSEFRSEWFTDK